MAGVLVHRGPDGEGFHFDECIGLAHRRLSIIDVEGGKQPLCNEDGSVWVSFNGEIYNYKELRETLVARGHQFKTLSDTEVIVHLYEEEGEGFVSGLRGMFAIALWDSSRRKLILYRDRIGKKPLYYAVLKDSVVFGSEIKSLLQLPEVDRELDGEAISDYFSLLYIPAPKTIFKRVRKVRPAHYLVVDDKGTREKSYWDLSFDPAEQKTETQWCEDLLESYHEAVRLRLRSDVPLGAFLSGGVDSSSVVALMHKISGSRVTTCSIGFNEEEFDESQYAAFFARSLGTDHHEERVQTDALAILEKLAWYYDEPFADSSAIPTYYVSRSARRYVTVALSGDGGDENFAGYGRYHRDLLENRMRSFFPDHWRIPIFSLLGQWYPKLDWAPRCFRAKATFRALSFTPVEGYFYSVSGVKPEIKSLLLSREYQNSTNGYHPRILFEDFYARQTKCDHLSRLQYLDMKTYLVDDILVKVDRASMANSLEVRCPLLDHKFIETVWRIPSSLKLKDGEGKHILKKAMQSLLPKETLTRPKQGFAVPLSSWFRKDLKEISRELVLSRDPLGILNPATVRSLWDRHQSGIRDFSTELWTILMFRLWQQMYLKSDPSPSLSNSSGYRPQGNKC